MLNQCLAGQAPKVLPRALAQEPCGQALFGTLVEGLADRFEPSLCDAYARLFAQAVGYLNPEFDPPSLVARYERVRRVRKIAGNPKRVFVLSRVTLGADVAVTSVILAAAKRRFPHSEIVLVGPRKNWELFAADKRIHHADVAYQRGSLRERLKAWEELKSALAETDSVVIDPDSRLTQLGLLPICSEDQYHLFESRSFGGESDRSLPELTAEWAELTLTCAAAKPYVAVTPAPPDLPYAAVSLGVGGNPAKRLPDPFEEELLRLLAKRGMPLYVDRGAGGEEAQRVTRAAERSGAKVTFWEGSFAGFAAIITGAKLYAGYDSAGQHIAAAAGIPLISIFAGFPVARMFERWRPVGENCTVIRVDRPDVDGTLTQVAAALETASGLKPSAG